MLWGRSERLMEDPGPTQPTGSRSHGTSCQGPPSYFRPTQQAHVRLSATRSSSSPVSCQAWRSVAPSSASVTATLDVPGFRKLGFVQRKLWFAQARSLFRPGVPGWRARPGAVLVRAEPVLFSSELPYVYPSIFLGLRKRMVRPPPPLPYIILLKSLAGIEKFKGPRGTPACGPPRADPRY